jgi:hypothetical protein
VTNCREFTKNYFVFNAKTGCEVFHICIQKLNRVFRRKATETSHSGILLAFGFCWVSMCTCRVKNFTRSLVPCKDKFNLSYFQGRFFPSGLNWSLCWEMVFEGEKNALIIKGQQLLLITRRSPLSARPKVYNFARRDWASQNLQLGRRLSAAARSFYGRIMRRDEFVIDETLGKTHWAEWNRLISACAALIRYIFFYI